ncbi:MAG: hypothetical protein ACJ8F7_17460, partial [Gemmataceae bacterium]
NFVCFSSAVVRRVVLEHVGGFDSKIDLAVDYDLWLRVAGHYRFDYVDDPLVKYRMGHGNLSQRVGERLKTALLLMNRFVNDYGGNVDPAVVRRSLAETYCNLGLALRPYAPLRSGRWFLRAIGEMPRYRPAWRGLVGGCVPARFRGKWEQAYRSPANDPRNI